MEFKSGQRVVCVDNLDMGRSLVVGETYVVDKQLDARLVSIKGTFAVMYSERFVAEGHKHLKKIIELYDEIKELDKHIQESYNLESDRGDDYFWHREAHRGNIDVLEQIINSLREAK